LKPVLIIAHLDVVEAKREDWSTDPFQFVEKDGYFYGRGTQDMKDSDAIAVTNFIRLKKEGFVPDRDIILALTADEEGGKSNGVRWLLKEHRNLIDAEFALNPDSGQVRPDKPMVVGFEATEKLYADYQVLATNPGGHSSLPTPDNAIYHVADALAILQKSPFPFEINPVTREYFSQMAKLESAQTAADMRAILATPPDPKAIERLSQDTHSNAIMRTTCVATMLSGGHATNALPGRAEANVICSTIRNSQFATAAITASWRIMDPIAKRWCRRR
jgi:acetylornithine deacetylase/succinyl-diaminopimelate desuccinylase-like protein